MKNVLFFMYSFLLVALKEIQRTLKQQTRVTKRSEPTKKLVATGSSHTACKQLSEIISMGLIFILFAFSKGFGLQVQSL